MTEAPVFSIPVADLEYGDRELDEPIPVSFLAAAFANTEAVPRGTPGHLEATVSKSGREVMVRGHARAAVTMPCARTLDPVQIDVRAEVFLMLRPGPAPAPKAARPERPGKARKGSAAARPGAGTGRRKEKEEERPLSDEEAATDTYDGEHVVLDRFIEEFLVLELPMFPLREDLRSETTPAIERPPEPAEGRGREGIDPRLAPLAAIASRLRDKKE